MFGLGLPEIIILLIVVGGLVYALRGRPSARRWVFAGVFGAIACGLALLAGGWFIGLSRAEHRIKTLHSPAQADPHALDRNVYPPVDLPRAYQRRFHTDEVPTWVLERQREIEARAQVMQSRAEERRVAAKTRGETWERADMPERVARNGASVIAPKPLPEWVTEQTNGSGNDQLFVVRGGQYANPEAAKQDALVRARPIFRDRTNGEMWDITTWLTPELILDLAVVRQHTTAIVRRAGENEFTVYRTYLLVDLSPSVISKLESIWRTETKALHRSQVLILVAILTGIAALLAGFFRLDDRTKGRYRWPLVGATALGIVFMAVVPVLAIRSIEQRQQRQSTPTIEPREAPRPRIYIAPPPESRPENPHRLIGDHTLTNQQVETRSSRCIHASAPKPCPGNPYQYVGY